MRKRQDCELNTHYSCGKGRRTERATTPRFKNTVLFKANQNDRIPAFIASTTKLTGFKNNRILLEERQERKKE